MSLLDQFLDRLRGEESLEIEFKRGKGGLPKDLWPTVSAFANTNGGWIIIGVREDDGKFVIEGVPKPEQRLEDLNNLLRNPNKISHPVCGVGDASIELLDDEKVLVLRVPAASRKARPIYIDGNPYTGTFIRRHTGDYHCTKPEVDRMMREASDDTADSAILENYGLDDIDPETLARYRRRFQTQDIGSPRNAYDDKRFLEAVRAFGRDRRTGKLGLTVAGLLMFGTQEALMQWRSRHLIDYRFLSEGSSSRDRWDDRVAWEGNLLGAFETLYPKLTSALPVPFALKDGARSGDSPIHIAVREALVNLLVHADYSESKASVIFRSSEGYFFRNPGNSRIAQKDLLEGDRSDPRNPILVSMFRFVGLADEAGTGIPKIVQAWRELGLEAPLIDVGTERYEFTLRLRYVHLLSEGDREWLRSLGGKWDEAEQLALVSAKNSGSVDNAQLRLLTGQHPADASKTLTGLRDRGLLQSSRAGRSTFYELGRDAAEMATDSVLDTEDAGEDPISPDNIEWSPSHNGGSFNNKDESLGNKTEEIIPMPGSFMGSASEWTALVELATPGRERQRMQTTERDSITNQLCRHIPLSVEELADLMDCSVSTVRKALRRLKHSGAVEYFYPDPSHPDQRYVSSQGTLFGGERGS